MIKRILLGLLFVLSITSIYSQADLLDTQKARKSIVKIMVKVPGSTDASVCTGFVWKQKDWIVTSLHAMHPKGNVTVIYNSGDLGIADVIKVYERADLVLLKVRDVSSLSADVVPLLKYSSAAIPRKTEMTAIGYGLGAKASRGNPLKRGDIASPETLERALPVEAVKKLKGYEIPDLELDIIMLDGSLLPGFSGSPIFNDKTGELIAIGEGGLENGTQALSWGIPAKYLAELEKSTNSIVSTDFIGSPLHHSSAVKITNEDVKAKIEEQPDMDIYAELELLSEQYSSIVYDDYEFFYVKTRTYEELYETSFDTDNLDSLRMEFESLGLYLDFSLFEFDVYEDPFHGVILVVPAGMPLGLDNYGYLFADLTALPMGPNFSLYYGLDYTFTDIGSATQELKSQMDVAGFGPEVGGFQIWENKYYSYSLDDYSSIAWMMISGNSPYKTSSVNDYGETITDENNLLFYYTVLFDKYERNTTFYGRAQMWMHKNVLSYMTGDITLNCIDIDSYAENYQACDYFESWMKVVISAHLTSYSYIQYVEYDVDGEEDFYYEDE